METNILYNIIGSDYDHTRKADDHISQRLVDLLLPQVDGVYLDIGCGTGNYTNKLASKGINFYGVDPSEQMLDQATSRNNGIKWILGSAEDMPVEDSLFSGAIATLTIHHWNDLEKAFSEIHRVLKPGSRIVIFTADPEQMKGYWLNHYFPNMLEQSIDQMPSPEDVTRAAEAAGLTVVMKENYFIHDDLQDHFLYVGKNNPQLYFQRHIRKGISSFASLANAEEVGKGLSELEKDVLSENFNSVKQSYQNDLGDYLFLVLEKK